MKHLFSRYGGHGILFGNGKASDSELPADQSFENVIKNHSIQISLEIVRQELLILPLASAHPLDAQSPSQHRQTSL